MNIVAHQPHFLPWLGYFNKLANADMYVVQDNVQFRKRYFQNRTRIRGQNSDCLWLTVPVHATRDSMISDVQAHGRWKNKLLRTISYVYKKAPHFDRYYSGIEEVVLSSDGCICALNIALLKKISAWLEI